MRQFGNRSQLIAQRQAQVVRSETEWLIAKKKKEEAEASGKKEEAAPAEAASNGISSDSAGETRPGTQENESSASGDDHGKRYYRKAEEAYAQSRLDFANDYLSKENPVALKIELRTAKKYWDFFSMHLVEEGVGNRMGDEIRPYSFDEFLAHATIKNGMVSIAAVGADNRTETQKKEEPTAELFQTQEQEQEPKPEPVPQNQTDQAPAASPIPAVTEKENEQKPIEVKEEKEQGNISYERVVTEKWNNTGFKFSARNGKVLTSGEVYKFIQEEKKKGNEEFIAAFKPHIKGKDAEGAYPTFEIAGSKIKFFAYSFDPEFGKKKEEEKEDAQQITTALNTQAIVKLKDSEGKPFKGIRLHSSPSPVDAQYLGKRGIAATIYGPQSKLTILGRSEEKNPGWVYVQSSDGNKGWIEENWLVKIDKGYGTDYTLHQVDEGEGVEKLLSTVPGLQRDIGYDNRVFAYVMLQMNKGNAGVYIDLKKYDESLRKNDVKNAFDPYFAGIRAVYQSIEVQTGAVVRVPTKAGIDKMRRLGQVPSRPDLMNAVIKGGRVAEGLMIGIPKGFALQAADLATGLWDIVKSVFTGELFNQLVQLYNAFAEMSGTERTKLLLQLVNIDVDKLKKVWESGNITIEARYEYMGEVIGRILFDVLLAVVTGGVMLMNTLAKIPAAAKILQVLEKVSGTMKGVTRLIPEEMMNKLKKTGGVIEKGKELAVAPIVFVSKEVELLLAKFPKFRKALSAVQAAIGNTKFAIFESILRTLPENVLKHLELHPELAERFAKKCLADNAFKEAMVRGELDKLDELEDAGKITITNKINSNTVKHIFEGEINSSGKAVGCHHVSSVNGGHSRLRPGEPITQGPDGLYRAKVDIKDTNGNWVEKNFESTFFPDSWSKDKVLEEISEAFRSPNKITTGNKWEAISPSGIKIGGYLDSQGYIATAFPIF